MGGFAQVSFIGEFFNQKVVNSFYFRSDAWAPLEGNPFDDVLAFVDTVIAAYKTPFLTCLPGDYTLRTVEAVGYNDSYQLVTSSPLIRTVDAHGAMTGLHGMGAAQAAIISLRCGDQVQINGIGHSKRNRGYVCVGPMVDEYVDDYSHLTPEIQANLEGFAQHLDDELINILPPCHLIPIRIHEKWLVVGPLRTLIFRTYSDVKGYRVNNVATYRKSRKPEA